MIYIEQLNLIASRAESPLYEIQQIARGAPSEFVAFMMMNAILNSYPYIQMPVYI